MQILRSSKEKPAESQRGQDRVHINIKKRTERSKKSMITYRSLINDDKDVERRKKN